MDTAISLFECKTGASLLCQQPSVASLHAKYRLKSQTCWSSLTAGLLWNQLLLCTPCLCSFFYSLLLLEPHSLLSLCLGFGVCPFWMDSRSHVCVAGDHLSCPTLSPCSHFLYLKVFLVQQQVIYVPGAFLPFLREVLFAGWGD